MPRKVREGPRLEVVKHQAAEERLRWSLMAGVEYEGKAEDLELARRKAKERGARGVRRALGGGRKL